MMNDDYDDIDGAGIAAKILGEMGSGNRARLMELIKQKDPATAAKIVQNAFNFEDIATLTDASIQVLLKEVNHGDLILALKAASQSVKNSLYKNMTSRRRTVVEEDLRTAPPVRLSEAEEAQKRILRLVDRLRTAGAIRARGEDDILV